MALTTSSKCSKLLKYLPSRRYPLPPPSCHQTALFSPAHSPYPALMITEEFTFKNSAGDRLAASTSLNDEGDPPEMLMLHGAGAADRSRTAYIAAYLAQQGIGSLRFDHAGCGESSGAAQQQSLQTRFADAKAALRQMDGTARIVMGSSMGAAVAVNLLETITPEVLILFCPAAYAATARSVPFDSRFTTIIRAANSWQTSLTFDQLENFKGRVLMVIGSDDKVIPPDVIDRYEAACANCSRLEILILEGAPHALHLWLQQPENKSVQDEVLETILDFVQNPAEAENRQRSQG